MNIFNYPKPLWKIRSMIGALLVTLSVPLWAPFVLISAITRSRQLMTWTIRSWNITVLFLMGVKVRLHFETEYNPKAPCLVVTNHQSHLDIPSVYYALNGHIRMVAKRELFRIPIFGQCLAAAEFIPIDRGNREAGIKAIQKIRARIRSGLQVWVAPEGTRSIDGKLQKFKTGSFLVAIESGVPVQPVVVKGAVDILNKKELFPRPGMTIDFYVLPQIPTEGYKPEDRHIIAELTHSAIEKILLS